MQILISDYNRIRYYKTLLVHRLDPIRVYQHSLGEQTENIINIFLGTFFAYAECGPDLLLFCIVNSNSIKNKLNTVSVS